MKKNGDLDKFLRWLLLQHQSINFASMVGKQIIAMAILDIRCGRILVRFLLFRILLSSLCACRSRHVCIYVWVPVDRYLDVQHYDRTDHVPNLGYCAVVHVSIHVAVSLLLFTAKRPSKGIFATSVSYYHILCLLDTNATLDREGRILSE